MFAVLEIKNHEKGFFKSVRRLFQKDETLMEYCTVKGATPFIIIKVTEKRSGVNWNEVRNAAGVCSQRLLVSKDVFIPKGYKFDRFKPSVYRILPLFNSFMQVIRTFEKRNSALNVTVLDRAGILSGKIDSLLDFARHITVLTDNIHDYKTASQRVMDSCGAAIVINDYDYPEVSDSVVFCDEYDDRLKNCPVVFCADENAASEKIINGYELEAEDFVLEKKPESIDLFDFAAALYELNDLKRAGEFAFSKLKISDKEVSIEEMKKMIKNAIDFK